MQLDTTVYRVSESGSGVPARQPIEVTMNEHVQTATSAPLFNPLPPEFIRDPYPTYARLRTDDPMHLTQFGTFLAIRHPQATLGMPHKRFANHFIYRPIPPHLP